MNLFNLENKRILVVGGSGGLGFSIVEAFYYYKAKIVVIDLIENKELMKFSELYFIKSDISIRNEIITSFTKALEFLGGIDVLVNCAGIQRRNPSESFSLEDWDDVININLSSVFLFCKLAGIEMLKNKYGKIINISSIISFVGGTNIPAYASSKGGISQLTKALSNDWSSKGINVNAIAPGYFDTSLNKNLINKPERLEKILAHIPMGRWGSPDEIKGLAVFLASDSSSYITGSIIAIDGGYLSW
jgi:2-deoxy-D-gluconate 3-dehydrogenase